MTKTVRIGSVSFANNLPFALISGPCQLETKDHAFMICETIKKAADKLKIGYVFKASFDKANRTSLQGIRGVGLEKGLEILSAVKKEFNVPVLTDIHEIDQIAPASAVVDVLQIPAFLVRQTDLVLAIGAAGKPVNVKKAQFMAPWDVPNIIQKIESTGNDNILLTERGVSFGYNTLVCDMTGLAVMAETGYPVVIDATHAVQKPSGAGGKSGGNRDHAKLIARAAVAAGVAGVFLETHQDPDHAPSDGPNSIRLADMPRLLAQLKDIDAVVKELT